MITTWEGHQEVRRRLIAAAERVRRADQELGPMPNRTYFNNTVKSMQGLPCHPAFEEMGAAMRAFEDLKDECVREHNLHIHLVRHVTQPILNNHPAELERLDRMLKRAHAQELRWRDRENMICIGS